MRFSFKELLNSPCQNIWHEMMSAGIQIGASVEVPDEFARDILAQCGQTAPSPIPSAAPGIQPILFEQWPTAFQLLAKLAKPQDTGLGDIIERVVGPIGGVKFKLWHKHITGRDCGCGTRKQTLNERYPLSQKNQSTQ
jgi:hypothetical protein